MQEYKFYFDGHLIGTTTRIQDFIPMVVSFCSKEFARFDSDIMVRTISEIISFIENILNDEVFEKWEWYGIIKFEKKPLY